MPRLRPLVLTLVAALALALGACGDDDDDGGGGGSDAASKPAKAKQGTLQLWVGGNFAGATPGTPYREWLDNQIARFKEENKGSDVKITLLSTDNEQVAAKLQAAFQADQAPDMMLFYSGGYTTPYVDQLLELNEYFDATPGFFDSLAGMDLSCEGLDCDGGKNTIIAVPQDFGTYALFYNKAMFEKAGVQAPIEDWDGLVEACDKLKASGVTPITFGDREGYSTDNWVTLMYGSYFDEGDIAKVNEGELKYADPKLVQPLAAARRAARGRLPQQGRVVSGELRRQLRLHVREERDGADVRGRDPRFQEEARQGPRHHADPQASDGPLAGRSVGDRFYNWVITKDSSNPGLAWGIIKVASDETAAGELLTVLGTPPANTNVDDSVVSDEFVQFFVDASEDPAMPVLDSVIPVPVALTYYKELQQALSGKKTGRRRRWSRWTSSCPRCSRTRPERGAGPRQVANRDRLWGAVYALPALGLVAGVRRVSARQRRLSRVHLVGRDSGAGVGRLRTTSRGSRRRPDLPHVAAQQRAVRDLRADPGDRPDDPCLADSRAHARLALLPLHLLPARRDLDGRGRARGAVVFRLDGPLNAFSVAVGLSSLERDWLGEGGRRRFRRSCSYSSGRTSATTRWIYLAGMSALDPSLARGRADGRRARPAGALVGHRAEPKRVMELVLVTSTVTAFAFMVAYIYVITNGGPGFDTYVTEFMIYKQAFAVERPATHAPSAWC